MMTVVSTPGASSVPSTSTMRPSAGRVGVGQRVISHGDHLAGRGALRLALRHLHVHDQTPIERHDEPEAGAVRLVAADDAFGAAFENADDAAFGAIAVAAVLDAHHDAVAVHRLIEVVARDVDAGRAVRVRASPASTNPKPRGLVDTRPTMRFIRSGRPNRLPRISTRAPGRHEGAETPLEGGALIAGDVQELQQLAGGGRMVHLLPDERENLFFRKHYRKSILALPNHRCGSEVY